MHVYGKYPSITQLQRYGHDDVTLVISRKKKKLLIDLYEIEYSNFWRYIFNIMVHNLRGGYLPT